MKAYVGQTRAADLVAQLRAAGIGECTTRGELPPRRSPWFYDCGAFGDFEAGRPFDFLRYSRDLVSIRRGGRAGVRWAPPDFVLLPDVVCDWAATVRQARDWAPEAHATGRPVYLVLQDGAELAEVAGLAGELHLAGLFVGGSLDWKLQTAAAWVQLAHDIGIACHVGRVGTAARVAWALAIDADSIDSSFPLWSCGHLAAFLAALAGPGAPPVAEPETWTQAALWSGTDGP